MFAAQPAERARLQRDIPARPCSLFFPTLQVQSQRSAASFICLFIFIHSLIHSPFKMLTADDIVLRHQRLNVCDRFTDQLRRERDATQTGRCIGSDAPFACSLRLVDDAARTAFSIPKRAARVRRNGDCSDSNVRNLLLALCALEHQRTTAFRANATKERKYPVSRVQVRGQRSGWSVDLNEG